MTGKSNYSSMNNDQITKERILSLIKAEEINPQDRDTVLTCLSECAASKYCTRIYLSEILQGD